jgi:hypothetical protein
MTGIARATASDSENRCDFFIARIPPNRGLFVSRDAIDIYKLPNSKNAASYSFIPIHSECQTLWAYMEIVSFVFSYLQGAPGE